MAAGSSTAVLAAVVGNTLVMITKFIAYGVTDSGTMLSEGIHSAADVFNQVLLMIGIWASGRAADAKYPYGYHTERFIWALISAVGIFFIGAGVTGYHGIHSLIHPAAMIGQVGWAFGVLIFSFVLEAIVLIIAIQALRRAAAGRPFLQYLRREADPTAVAVLLEDGVAVTGVLVAMAAIGLTTLTGSMIWDGIGSVIIAALLGVVAIILIAQNRRLLIGTAVPSRIKHNVLKTLNENPSVEAVYDFKSRMLSVDTYRVKMEVEFDGAAIARKLEPGLIKDFPELSQHDQFSRLCENVGEQVIDALGDEIDAIEKQILAQVPGVKHVDIETD